MSNSDVFFLVLADHIVLKLAQMCRTFVLLNFSDVCIHIAKYEISTDRDVDYEDTIMWDQTMEEVMATKEKLLCELQQCTTSELKQSMTGVLEKQYQDLAAGLMVMMMREEIDNMTGYHIEMVPGRITINLHLRTAGYKTPTIEEIVVAVAKVYGIEKTSLLGGNREAAMPRKVSMYMARKLTSSSLDDIGNAFQRKRSTVIYAIQKIERELETGNNALQTVIKEITEQLKF